MHMSVTGMVSRRGGRTRRALQSHPRYLLVLLHHITVTRPCRPKLQSSLEHGIPQTGTNSCAMLLSEMVGQTFTSEHPVTVGLIVLQTRSGRTTGVERLVQFTRS